MVSRVRTMKIVPAAECIFHVKELISTDLCRTIIENYHRDPRKHPGYTGGEQGETKLQDEIKVSTDLEITKGGDWTAPFDALNQAVNAGVTSVAAQIPLLPAWPLWWTGYKIQHYKKNEGHFKWHFDALGPGTWHRQIAMIIYLNSVAGRRRDLLPSAEPADQARGRRRHCSFRRSGHMRTAAKFPGPKTSTSFPHSSASSSPPARKSRRSLSRRTAARCGTCASNRCTRPHRADARSSARSGMTRSGCGIVMVTRPSGLVSAAMPSGEPLGLAG